MYIIAMHCIQENIFFFTISYLLQPRDCIWGSDVMDYSKAVVSQEEGAHFMVGS